MFIYSFSCPNFVQEYHNKYNTDVISFHIVNGLTSTRSVTDIICLSQ